MADFINSLKTKENQFNKFDSFGLIIILFIIINLSFINCYDLNNILVFNSKNYRAGSFAFTSNEDMVIQYSYQNSRLFYGLKKNGKGYFVNSNNEETSTKEITIESDTSSNHRYESRSLFISLNDDSSGTQYYFNTGTDITITELINLETGEYKNIETYDFFGHSIYSYAFSSLSVENEKLYYVIFLSESDKNVNAKQISFSSFDLSSATKTTNKTIDSTKINRIVTAFISGEKIIILYLGNDSNLYININNLYFSNTNSDVYIDVGGFNSGYGVFFKGIHIKDDLMGFMYYSSYSNFALQIKIGHIESDSFVTKFSKSLTEYGFYSEEILNDFIKINDEKLAYLGVIVDVPNKFKILIFDLYNNYEYMKIRVYDLEFSNYKINREIALAVFNNYLVFSSTVTDISKSNQVNDNSLRYSILIIFGYINGTDNSIDITDYLKDEYINSINNIVTDLTGNIQIDNNIFGYVILTDRLKLPSIPNDILFYNISNNSLLSSGDILSQNYNFIQNTELVKTNEYYSLDYQIIIQEPDYTTYDNTATSKISISSVDQENYYNPKLFYGRTNTLKFKLCYEYCATCTQIGIKISDQKCKTCLDEYNYSFYNDYSNCIDEGYFIDKQNNIRVKCTTTNSKYYNDLETGKRICFNINYDCPPIYPYLNISTNECHNRAPPTTILTTIPTTIPTTISTTVPTTILTTLPITMLTTILTTAPTTVSIFKCTYVELLNKLCSFLDYNNTEIYFKILNEVIETYPSIDGNNLVIEGKANSVFQLTTTDNEIDTFNGNYENSYNLSIIDLNECESLLKSTNGIDESLSLIFLKFEKLTGVAAEKNVQYEVYEPNNKTRLDLSICQNSIDLYLPISLSDKTKNLYDNLKEYGYDLFNINDTFYADICARFRSENGTDVILADRKNDYYTNETTCQANCQYSEYFSESSYLKCECYIVTEEIITVDMDKFNGKVILDTFYKVLKYSNYEVVKCYKLVFNTNVISKNFGSLVVIAYCVLYFPFLFLFIKNGIVPIKIDAIKIISDKSINPNNNEISKNIINTMNNKSNNKYNEKKREGKKTNKIQNNQKQKNDKQNQERINIRSKSHKKAKKPTLRNINTKKTNFPPKRKNNFSKILIKKYNNNESNDNNNLLIYGKQKKKYKTKI